MDLNNTELMDAVRKYPAIYDKAAPEYKDRNKKSNAWKNVADSLNVEISLCQTRYRTIRTKFGKYLTSLKPPSGSGQTIKLKKEYEELKWLLTHIKARYFIILTIDNYNIY